MGFFLKRTIDFARHNDEVRRVWEAYEARRPYRTPVTVGGSIRNLFENPAVNDTGYTFADFFTDPEAQIRAQLAYQKWVRFNLVCDREMGPPAAGWQVGVDFQNSWEQAWYGCPLRFFGDGVPDTVEILKERKERLFDLEPPDPLRGGLLGRAMEFFEYMQDRCPRMEFEGRPVLPPRTIPGESSDGLFTIACKLRGTAELCLDLYEDPEYFHALMDFVTANAIRRMKAVREWRWARDPASPDRGVPKMKNFGLADDSIALLSVAQYREHILPYHRRLVAEFSDGGPTAIHLCGDATRHFPLIRDELNVRSFDTGFPVDFGALRAALGPEVQILGGPSIMELKEGPADAVRRRVAEICSSGIMEGGRFVLREGNNLAPRTPVEHVEAMYDAALFHGGYRS